MFQRILLFASLFASLIVSPFLAQAAIAGPSFDCHANTAPAEQTICANADLADLDSQMAQLYFQIANDSTGRYYKRLKQDQHQWLRERNDCGWNVRCLRMIYRARVDELTNVLSSGD